MILSLRASVGALALTGRLCPTDRCWSDEGVVLLIVGLAWVLRAPVCLHIAGVFPTGRRQHESLLPAMFSGRKRRRD